MEPKKKTKIIQWEDYQHELARFSSLSSALEETNRFKYLIQEKLNTILKLEVDSLSRKNELDELRDKLESRKRMMKNMSMRSKVVREKAKKQDERLNAEIRPLLVAGTALSVARKRLQEANKSLAGDKGYVHLQTLQKLLRARQQVLASQISLLYPVKALTGHTRQQELESHVSTNRSVNPKEATSWTILGMHLNARPFTKMNFLTDKIELLRSATALGYIAHAVSLITLYMEIPLRYPIRLGASKTYICDYAPSVETIFDLTSTSPSKPTKFPLFLDCQDTTRSDYALFLLNKDLEQLLNCIGVESLGPRHVLANFKELLDKTISREHIPT
ncbi:vacuolar protein sorting 38-like [Rutidosis leptorrhynchoides]|uniref:vacuolar protein sorting 38-like n=1 Tax=Rutidosis leptorrhynchoides TaxID=125765 RepID=UPI003A9A2BA7